MTRVSVAAGLTLLVGLGCCHARDPNEPRAIARAFEEFEGAAPSDRAAALAALRDVRCVDVANCADRDECVRYATAVTRTKELVNKAQTLGPEDGGGNGAATPEERSVIVAAASDALREAERFEPPCLEALRRLHQRAADSP